MLRLPAVAGRFYPSDPEELAALIHRYTTTDADQSRIAVKACLVPHAGYVYSGHVAGAVLAGIELPKERIVLGVRHYQRGGAAALLSSGVWRTPVGVELVDELREEVLRDACP